MSERAFDPSLNQLQVMYHPQFDFAYCYPDNWHQTEPIGQPTFGAVYSPSPDDASTCFSVEAIDLGMEVQEEDIDTLREGFVEGLSQLPESEVQYKQDFAAHGVVGLEAHHTFREDGILRRRWVRLYYHGTTQIRIICQGATTEVFDELVPLFFKMMNLFQFGRPAF